MRPDDLLAGHPDSQAILTALAAAIGRLGDHEVRVSKSQIAFRRRHTFALAWRPGQYLQGQTAPLVLTLSFPAPDPSPRWKEIVRLSPQRFTHHLELQRPADVDKEVEDWLAAAWAAAA